MVASSGRETQAWRSVVFLDLDGTAIQGPFQTAVFPLVLRAIGAKAGLPVARVQRLVFSENAARQADPGVPAVVAMDWDDIIETVARRLGVASEMRVQAVANAHAGPPNAWPLDGAKDVLRALAAPGRAVVAATNGLSKYQVPVLEALGLLPLFTDVLTPDRHGALKKDIAFYGPWANAAPLRISVGDTYEDDVLAPKRFGFRAAWKVYAAASELAEQKPFDRPSLFNYGQGQVAKPDAIILSLSELPGLVEQWETYGDFSGAER